MQATQQRRRGRGKSQKTLEMVYAAREILEEIQPASVRAVCYQLFTRGLIKDMSKGQTDMVSRNLVWAREEGIVPWHHIVDETRRTEKSPAWATPLEIMNLAIGQYRKDFWREQPVHVEVWAEKGTVRGTLASVLEQFAVPFRVMHGYGSATSLYDVAIESFEALHIGCPFVVIYVGDFDPSGMHMSEVDIPARLSRYGGEVDIERAALTRDQCDDLPSFSASTKRGDGRHDWFVERYGQTCWELDAMSPNDLREEVEGAIWSHIDIEAWEHCEEIEAAEKESLAAFKEGLPSILGQALKNSGGEL